MPTMPPLDSVPVRARVIYRAMGLMVDSTRLPFVASLRYLAGPTPDSTLALFTLSLANRVLTFRRDGNEFVAAYHVELGLRKDSVTVRQLARDATVRVGSPQETMRRDESIVFQQILLVPPGTYTVTVVVRDRASPAYARQELVDTAPRIEGVGLGGPVPVYEGTGRGRVDSFPKLLVNPRGAAPYDTDSLRFYVEGYGLPKGTRLAARVVDADTVELWRDTVALSGGATGAGGITTARFVIRPGILPLGRATFEVTAVGGTARATTPFLVSFSDAWAVTSFGQMLGLLRYYRRPDLVAKLGATTKDGRPAAWREFYRATDPSPVTSRNDSLDAYFQRIELANRRFQEPAGPGWRTDRGEVFVTLGEPDQAYEVPGRRAPGIRWEYPTLNLTLAFKDDRGLGQYHLTLESRADYERALARTRATP